MTLSSYLSETVANLEQANTRLHQRILECDTIAKPHSHTSGNGINITEFFFDFITFLNSSDEDDDKIKDCLRIKITTELLIKSDKIVAEAKKLLPKSIDNNIMLSIVDSITKATKLSMEVEHLINTTK
jgi:hypothetical protein